MHIPCLHGLVHKPCRLRHPSLRSCYPSDCALPASPLPIHFGGTKWAGDDAERSLPLAVGAPHLAVRNRVCTPSTADSALHPIHPCVSHLIRPCSKLETVTMPRTNGPRNRAL